MLAVNSGAKSWRRLTSEIPDGGPGVLREGLRLSRVLLLWAVLVHTYV